MFCRQCEQTANGTGCDAHGVCGKNPQTSDLQDALIHMLKSISAYANPARENGLKDDEIDIFVIEGLFTTITNVNFDPLEIKRIILRGIDIREKAKKLFEKSGAESDLPDIVKWVPFQKQDELSEQIMDTGILSGDIDGDIRALREILLYGLKGMAAYADHAGVMGKKDEKVTSFFHKGLASLLEDRLTKEDYLSLIMEFGQVNLRCMEILDQAHTNSFGHPTPTKVALGTRKGPAIIVSGHDLSDIKAILEQTEGTGINVYTHGEMLAAHGYPKLSQYPHLAGHFGSAWQNQNKEFQGQPAAFLFTTNCIQKPHESYADRVYTTGLVRYPGIPHIGGKTKDFTPVMEKALELKGFEDENTEKEIIVGFGHNALSDAAEKIAGAVKHGRIRRFFLIGGCDGAKPGRNYYSDMARKIPKDCIIITLACGKFRLNRMDFGSIDGIPRLIDCGQCNDAYSAIKMAKQLSKAFECTVNDLPLSFILSWYEQKAVCILLTLFSLGIRGIRLGPTLPAFITPNILAILSEKFDIKPIKTPEEDLKEIFAQ